MAKNKKKLKKAKNSAPRRASNVSAKRATFRKLKAKKLKKRSLVINMLTHTTSKKVKPPKPVKLPKLSAKGKERLHKAEKLITKGRERGFVTYDEILREFPTIESDIRFLDELYEKLSTASIDVLEGGGMLNAAEEAASSKSETYGEGSGAYDSIQIYLKEIGKKPDLDVPMIMMHGCTLRKVCERLHKDFVAKFRFARIWGSSVKFAGMKVMKIDHALHDNDIVEIRLK